jgi:response regulator RpfG family c-di-GMP phosphodiesterase
MEQKQLDEFKKKFDEYIAGFYGDDEYINANLKLKEDHSSRTCEEMRYLADELALTAGQKRIAEATALFHDIGRFKQFAEYRTYNDHQSVGHCQLSVEILRQTNVLAGLEEAEKEIIEKAIEYHGCRELPSDLDGECLLFSKLLRDADKLDIFNISVDCYKRHRENPAEYELEMDFPDVPEYSAEVVEAILNEQRFDYGKLRTWNDMKLLQLGWVYDVNFTATLRRIRKRKFLEKIVDFLPQTGDIEKVKEKVFEYVDSAIERGEVEVKK